MDAYGPLPEPLPSYADVTVETLGGVLDIATGSLVVDAEGHLFVANIGPVPDRSGTDILKIAPDGTVSEFVTSGLDGASGIIFGPDGNIYQSNFSGGYISQITPAGQVSTYVSDGIVGPIGLAFDSQGNLFVADCRGDRLQMVTPQGESSVFVNRSGMSCPNGLAIDEHDNLYVANFANGKVLKVSPAGEVTLLATLPGGNNGHLVYYGGVLYVIDRGAHHLFQFGGGQ